MLTANCLLGFKLLFPCSGRKEGIVDLGFHLNYTSDGLLDEKHLDIVVRRHCVVKGELIPNQRVPIV